VNNINKEIMAKAPKTGKTPTTGKTLKQSTPQAAYRRLKRKYDPLLNEYKKKNGYKKNQKFCNRCLVHETSDELSFMRRFQYHINNCPHKLCVCPECIIFKKNDEYQRARYHQSKSEKVSQPEKLAEELKNKLNLQEMMSNEEVSRI
jgi:hypothetical protein